MSGEVQVCCCYYAWQRLYGDFHRVCEGSGLAGWQRGGGDDAVDCAGAGEDGESRGGAGWWWWCCCGFCVDGCGALQSEQAELRVQAEWHGAFEGAGGVDRVEH